MKSGHTVTHPSHIARAFLPTCLQMTPGHGATGRVLNGSDVITYAILHATPKGPCVTRYPSFYGRGVHVHLLTLY